MIRAVDRLTAGDTQAFDTAGYTISIDLGDQWSHYCVLDEAGKIAEEGRFRTTESARRKHFCDTKRARIAMEAGTHFIWISEQLRQYGHEVLVAHVSELRAIARSEMHASSLVEE